MKRTSSEQHPGYTRGYATWSHAAYNSQGNAYGVYSHVPLPQSARAQPSRIATVSIAQSSRTDSSGGPGGVPTQYGTIVVSPLRSNDPDADTGVPLRHVNRHLSNLAASLKRKSSTWSLGRVATRTKDRASKARRYDTRVVFNFNGVRTPTASQHASQFSTSGVKGPTFPYKRSRPVNFNPDRASC